MSYDEYIWSYADEFVNNPKYEEEEPEVVKEANKKIMEAIDVLTEIKLWELDTIDPQSTDKVENIIDMLYSIEFKGEE